MPSSDVTSGLEPMPPNRTYKLGTTNMGNTFSATHRLEFLPSRSLLVSRCPPTVASLRTSETQRGAQYPVTTWVGGHVCRLLCPKESLSLVSIQTCRWLYVTTYM